MLTIQGFAKGIAAAIGSLVMSIALAHAQATPAPSVASSPDAIVAAANKEGSVTWYTNPGLGNTLREPLDAFRKQYPGIEVRIVEATGGDVMERVRAERSAGRLVADVVTLGDSAAYRMMADKSFQSLDFSKIPNTANLSARLKPFLGSDHDAIPTILFIFGFAVNTRALPEADHPKKWADLLDPRYSAKIGIHDFGRLGGGNTFLTIGLNQLGRPFFESLMQTTPRVYSAPQQLEAALVRGERAIAVPIRTRAAKAYAGAPIKFILPEDGTFFAVMQSGLIAGSQHPNAAYLFLNFLLSKGAQERFAETGDGPVVRGVPSLVDIETAKFLGSGAIVISDLTRQKELQALGQTLVQSQR